MSEITSRLYTYRIKSVAKVVDGDTLDVCIDLGFHLYIQQRVRLLGIDAPEKRGASREAGLASQRRLESLIAGASEMYIETKLDRTDKYGRILGRIWRAGWVDDLSARMLSEGLAVPRPDGGDSASETT
jgi:micrococcal nuclease